MLDAAQRQRVEGAEKRHLRDSGWKGWYYRGLNNYLYYFGGGSFKGVYKGYYTGFEYE